MKNVIRLTALICTALFCTPLFAKDFSFGNERLTLIMGEKGLMKNVLANGERIRGNWSRKGAFFTVKLLENVYGLADGKRRQVALRPISVENGLIKLAPENEPLPQFTFKTIDKGSYFVLKLISMKNPKNEHAIELNMKTCGYDWLPLDSVTKKTSRRGGCPSFFGLLQRSKKNPLGSIAMTKRGEDWDDVLYKIWTTEDVPHPKVDGEWTVERAKQWVDEYIRIICKGYKNEMYIGPRKPEDLKQLVDVAEKFGMNRTYMHLNSWGGRYWARDRDNFDVNRKIFPQGADDMVNFANYLESKDMRLSYRTISYALGGQHPEYLAKDNVDSRLASWWQGTLAENIDADAKQIKVAEGRKHLTRYDSNRRWKEIFNMKLMAIGNEIVEFKEYVDNGDGTWTLKGCKRGFGRTEPTTHKRGEVAKGLYRIYGQGFAPDPDSSMMVEMAKRFADFHNKTKALLANFDALEVHEMMYYYGDTKFMGEVYRHLDHPVAGLTSGPNMTWGYYEPLFNSVSNSKKVSGSELQRHGVPKHPDMKIGLHQSHWNASSPYAYVWAIPGTAIAGKGISVTAQAGFHDVTMEMIEKNGLIDHYAKECKKWNDIGPKLPIEIKKRIYSSHRNAKQGVDEIFRFKGEDDNLCVEPFRMLKRVSGIDRGWSYFQEHGTIYPYQYIRPGQTMRVNNPYKSQNPEFIIRVMPDFNRDITSLRSMAVGKTDEEKAFHDMLDKFQGASGVTIQEHEVEESSTKKKNNLKLLPDPGKIRNKGAVSFEKVKNGVKVSLKNDGDKILTLRGSKKIPGYGVNTNITGAGGLGVVVNGDGSNALLVIRVGGEGTRDYIVPIDFKGKRYVEIPSPQASWVDSRWGYNREFKRWRGNWIRHIGLWLDKVPPKTTSSVVVEDIRFLKEQPSALVNPSIKFGDGFVYIDGTIPSDRYLWYKGGGTVGVYDLNWNKLEDLRVKGKNARNSTGDIDISVINRNGNNDPWLEVQFFTKDLPMPVGAIN